MRDWWYLSSNVFIRFLIFPCCPILLNSWITNNSTKCSMGSVFLFLTAVICMVFSLLIFLIFILGDFIFRFLFWIWNVKLHGGCKFVCVALLLSICESWYTHLKLDILSSSRIIIQAKVGFCYPEVTGSISW